MDIVWQSDDGQVAIWQMDGTDKTAEVKITINPGIEWSVCGVGDFDQDGNSDILFQNGTRVGVWIMDGTSPKTVPEADETTKIFEIGSGTVVGVKDNLIYLQDDDPITVWEMDADEDGKPVIANQSILAVPSTGWRFSAVGDFDNDGQLEVAIRHNRGSVVIADTGTFKLVGVNPGLTTWKIVGATDLDQDGSVDLIWENTTFGDVLLAVWFVNSLTVPITDAIGEILVSAHVRAIGNFGQPAVVLQNDNGDDAEIWLLNANSVASTVTIGLPT
jgi:hypothetical protein